MPRTIQAEGRTITVPDDATPEEINRIFGPAQAQPKEPPGFTARFGEATGIPTSRAQWDAAQPTRGQQIADAVLGPAATAGRQVLDYGRNLKNQFQQIKNDPNVSPAGGFNDPITRFMLRGVLAPIGGTGVANLGEDVKQGNLLGAGGDILGTLVNALMMKGAMGPSAAKSVNRLTAAAGKDMLMPIEKTLPELRQASEAGPRTDSMNRFHAVATRAANTIQAEADAAMAPIANTQTMPTSIAQNIRNLVTRDMGHYTVNKKGKTVFVANTPEGAAMEREIQKQAQQFDKPWMYGDLDRLRMRLNSELNTFEKRGVGDRYNAKNGNINTAVDSTIANTIRDIVYPRMDQLTGRPQGYFRSIKQKQGNLMELQSELDPSSRKSRTTQLRQQTAEIQGSSRLSRENMSLHMGGSGVPRTSIYGLTNVIKKRNPLASANKRVRMGFSTGSPTAKAYTSTLPFRSSMFPATSEENQ